MVDKTLRDAVKDGRLLSKSAICLKTESVMIIVGGVKFGAMTGATGAEFAQ